jgi:glycine C-acetyltransferase
MYGTVKDELRATLQEIRDAGLYKTERRLNSPQSAHVTTLGAEAINFCANNYLGLANHPDVVKAAANALQEWGFGMASVRFICGTQELHTQLEAAISQFLGKEETILYSSCFDANGGVFEVLFGAEDAIITDELNHASLIDGMRLAKARRYRYKNADMADLEVQLEAAEDTGARRKVIVTDGVFSMDGSYAPLDRICGLAEAYDAMVLVDDSHAVGFVGEGGRGTHELFGVMDRVDLLTGTLGKALGGASGGYVSGPQEVIDLLRQRSRPYLFSNAVAPTVAAGSMVALSLAESSTDGRATTPAQCQAVPLADDRGWVRTVVRQPPDHSRHVPR